ncbi:hypothetical protein LZ554_004442 [Drepanopeziza brunnea f. sp. 'monogermtubi']|nr:hypothetical protein LZ554_004442 [Drepanopeziza brunnea f. sp. 'monogermtubi']
MSSSGDEAEQQLAAAARPSPPDSFLSGDEHGLYARTSPANGRGGGISGRVIKRLEQIANLIEDQLLSLDLQLARHLERGRGDDDDADADAAAVALAGFYAADGVPMLIDALQDASWGVREVVGYARGVRHTEALSLLNAGYSLVEDQDQGGGWGRGERGMVGLDGGGLSGVGTAVDPLRRSLSAGEEEVAFLTPSYFGRGEVGPRTSTGEPSATHPGPDHLEAETRPADKCVICLEDISDRCVLLPCRHEFDFDCVLPWLESFYPAAAAATAAITSDYSRCTCPLCRQPILSLHHSFVPNAVVCAELAITAIGSGFHARFRQANPRSVQRPQAGGEPRPRVVFVRRSRSTAAVRGTEEEQSTLRERARGADIRDLAPVFPT